MKIKTKHIAKFEAFIQNSKEQDDNSEQVKNSKKSPPVDKNEESENKDEGEGHILDEINKFFDELRKH